ncbi:gag-pol polyprotein [Tanacetum coccineum]
MEPGSSGSYNHGKSKTGKKKNNFKCFKCGKPAAVPNEGRKRFADVWLFDTGATFHMTARREWFHQYKPISGGRSVYSCNDHELKIIGIGIIMVNIHDSTVHTIRDVQHVEGLKKNLLSLGKLDDLGCKLKGEIMEEAKASVASDSPSHRVAVTWHQKLRHMSEQGMKILMERKLLPGLTKNGVAERMNITLLERARAMLATASLEKSFWAEAVNTVSAPHHEVNETNESQAPTTRTLNHERKRLRWHLDYVMESNVAYCLLTEEGESSTLQGALNNLDVSFWKEAMQEEMEALHKNKT